MTEPPAVPIVYIDANPFIYFVEGEEQLAARIRPFFSLLAKKSGAAVTSELTLAEVLAKATPPARRNYLNLIVWSKYFRLQPVTRDILIDTADYRSVSRKATKLPDAIHVVTAAKSKCRLFLSMDKGLTLPAEMTMLAPDDAGLANLTRELA